MVELNEERGIGTGERGESGDCSTGKQLKCVIGLINESVAVAVVVEYMMGS